MHCAPDDLCSECWDAKHRAEHPERVDGCLACKLDTIQLDAGKFGHSHARPRTPDNPWERGRAGEFRRDGSFMPLLNPDWSPMGVKQAVNRRPEIEAQRRRNAAGIPA